MSALLSTKDARRIALRQGLLAGTLGACITLLSTVVPLFTFNSIRLSCLLWNFQLQVEWLLLAYRLHI